MATKRKTPAPPRRVQAPQRRATPSRVDAEGRKRMILYAVAAVVVVALAAAVALLTVGGGDGGGGTAADDSGARAAVRAAGGTLITKPASEQGVHVEDPPPRSAYNTWPPTSGPHHPSYAPYLVYTEPVEEYRLVHNLEHGAIVIQYGSKVPRSDVQKIEDWWRDQPNGIVVAPMPELGDQIALTAWTTPEDDASARGTGVLAKLPRFDERAFDAFRSSYAFRGPERFPEELLAPGT